MSIDARCAVPVRPDEVWRYYSSPGAMFRLAPPFVGMRPVSEASSLRSGEAVLAPSSALPLPGPLGGRLGPKWIARHQPDGYIEGRQFVDKCVSQPYARLTGWEHTHTVGAYGDDSALLGDRVHARVPEPLLAAGLAYRYRQTAADLEAIARARAAGGDRRLTVAVTGARGLVGTQLCAMLGVAGHHVIRLVRGKAGDGERHWDVDDPASDLLEGVDVLVHLAGEPIAGRFTDAHLRAVRDSRVGPTRRLAEMVAAAGGRTALVCASAIGYYGSDRGDEPLDETATPGDDDVARIVVDWESACEPARAAGARVVTVRTGVAQSGAGGMLPPLATATRLGVGGKLGDGRHRMSWIGLDDLVDVYLAAVTDTSFPAVVNAVAPHAERNAEYTRTLGSVLRRPTVVPIPAVAPAVLLGLRGAEQLALADQWVVPTALEDAGFRFRQPRLRDTLEHELGQERLPGERELLGGAA